jgi:hypothetical protein
MIKSYLLHNEDGTIKQFTRCDETEIELYQSEYIEYSEDNFEFDSKYTYKIEDGVVIKNQRTDEIYLKAISRANRDLAVSNILVEYQGVVYQGDEISQDRMNRAINGLPDDITTITWKDVDNNFQQLTRIDLKEILFLAGQEQTRIWFN